MWTRPLREEDRWHPLTAIAVAFVCLHAVVGGRKEPSLAGCWGLGVMDEWMDRWTDRHLTCRALRLPHLLQSLPKLHLSWEVFQAEWMPEVMHK